MRQVGDFSVIEIVTDAWKSMSRAGRILKLERALRTGLTEEQLRHILRISVITPREKEEFDRLHPRTSAAMAARESGKKVTVSGKSRPSGR